MAKWNYDSAVKKATVTAEMNESIVETRSGTALDMSKFGDLEKYVEDTNITDIDYNGSDLWITDIQNEHKKLDLKLDEMFVQRLVQNIANSESKEFNQKNPVLEVETSDLRISIVHKSIAQTGTSFCIRKTPKVERITEKYAIDSKYTNKEILCLLANCIKAHMNIIICGEPRAGKTELAKFISGYIPEKERVITIEDVLEWHYKDLHPTADVIEMKCNKDFNYSDGIIASLKQNPSWIMIAETRGKEIKYLIQSLTTGVNGITTLHTDSVKKIPERMINMSDDYMDPARLENTIYSFVDVGILVTLKVGEDGKQYRIIDQIAFFANDNGDHNTCLVVEDGVFFKNRMPESIKQKFKKFRVEHPLKNDEVYNRLEEQGYNIKNSPDLSNSLTFEGKTNKNVSFSNNVLKPEIEKPIENNNYKTDEINKANSANEVLNNSYNYFSEEHSSDKYSSNECFSDEFATYIDESIDKSIDNLVKNTIKNVNYENAVQNMSSKRVEEVTNKLNNSIESIEEPNLSEISDSTDLNKYVSSNSDEFINNNKYIKNFNNSSENYISSESVIDHVEFFINEQGDLDNNIIKSDSDIDSFTMEEIQESIEDETFVEAINEFDEETIDWKNSNDTDAINDISNDVNDVNNVNNINNLKSAASNFNNYDNYSKKEEEDDIFSKIESIIPTFDNLNNRSSNENSLNEDPLDFKYNTVNNNTPNNTSNSQVFDDFWN